METDYQSYEYVTTGSVENGLNPVEQYIIVEDPTIVTDKNNIQYVEQVQSDLEIIENVAGPVYDANSQQFYIDLNVSPELAPMTVNSVETPGSNVYGTNSNPPVEMVLTDKQCELLQQRGWILLEMNDKVFLLDSTGLHDVTDDHKLVNKLKNENQAASMINQQSRCEMKEGILSNEFEGLNTNICADQTAYNKNEQMGIDYGNEAVEDSRSLEELFEIAEQERCDLRTIQDSSVQVELAQTQKHAQAENDNSDSTDDGNTVNRNQPRKIIKAPVSEYHLKGNKLSKRLTAIDSEYRLKEIPREVVLGKTLNGKNLVARVVKGKGFYKRVRKSRKEKRLAAEQESIVDEHQLAKLVEQVLLGTIEECCQEDIAAAEAAVSQLLQVHEFKSSLHEHKLIVTKTIREKNEYGWIEKQQGPTLVTGRVIMNSGERSFIYIPDLLQQHIILRDPENSDKIESENPEEDLFLHININEVKGVDNISRVSVTVHKRYLLLSPVPPMGKNAVFTCNLCSRTFNTMKSLKRHKENRCSEIPEISFHEKQPYSILKTNNTTEYMCNECQEKFVKQKDCLTHIQTHNTSDEEGTTAAKYLESFSDDKEQPLEHKCKLCTCSFSVASFLTEHIYEKHLTSNTAM